MKRGSLFFIGLISAIATFTSLNYALGRPGYYYDRYPYHNCNERYDRRGDEKNYGKHQRSDTTNSNY